MKKVITYGTFDMLHIGHVHLLRRAKALGDYLYVGISSDEFNALKNKKAYYRLEERRTIVEAIRYTDAVLIEQHWEQKRHDIIQHNIDIFVMGDDWQGAFDHLSDICQVIYLPRTVGISTTKIKQDLHHKR